MRERVCVRKRALGIVIVSKNLLAISVGRSAFQPISVGLGFRVIPALGGGAQQFQP
jgi:hypothetical protein